MDLAVLITQLQEHVRWGSGSPENVVSSRKGVLWVRSDGGVGTTLYVKEQDSIAGDPTRGWNPK